MSTNREKIFSDLEQAVVKGDKKKAIETAKIALSNGIPALDAINHGLIRGMNIVGDKYARREYFLPQVLIAADAMYGGLDVLFPAIPKEDAAQKKGVVLGVVEGDVHDIGKNIVKALLTSAGFEVHDLGRDVPVNDFVTNAESKKASVVAMSTLMTPTMDGMKRVIDGLIESGYRSKCKVIIGGGPTSPEFAEDIGADFHAVTAQEGVAKLKGVFQ